MPAKAKSAPKRRTPSLANIKKARVSAAERWIACPASVLLTGDLPEQESSEFAEQGSQAHALAENFIRRAYLHEDIPVANPKDFPSLGKAEYDAIQCYTDYLKSAHARPFAKEIDCVLEQGVETQLAPTTFEDVVASGTADYWVLTGSQSSKKNCILEVMDFKFGAGIKVEPKYNPQLLLYAYRLLLNHLQDYQITAVHLTIVQPRYETKADETPDARVRTWITDPLRIMRWFHNTALPALMKVKTKTAPKKGSHCRFCPAKPFCPEHHKEVDELMKLVSVNDKKIIDATPLREDIKKLVAVYEIYQANKKFLDSIGPGLITLLKMGKEVPGYIMGQSSGRASWSKEAVAAFVEQYGEDAMKKSLPSIRDVSTMPNGGDFVGQYAYKAGAGSPTLLKGEPLDPSKVFSKKE